MLNALRHQRFVHRFLLRFDFSVVSVLNALRHQRFVHFVFSIQDLRITVCAQRLTASEVRPPCRNENAVRSDGVLNALRHQRFVHLSEAYKTCTLNEVLNALRHQRFVHQTKFNRFDLLKLCSTPYGIRGSSTHPFGDMPTRDQPCSTPYGIRGSSTRLQALELIFDLVLNALRHQRFVHNLGKRNLGRKPNVLNALRHQRFVHAIAKRFYFYAKTVLNALRHQRFVHCC